MLYLPVVLKPWEHSVGGGLLGFAGTLTHQCKLHSCKSLLGDCQGTGPQEHKAGPSWNDLLSPPRKYMKWEGSGESGHLKELAVGKGSFLERGGNGFAKLGNWRGKRTKQPFGNFEIFFPVGYFFSSLV